MSELGKKVWQNHCFALVLHEIRVSRASALSYTELTRSGDFSGLLLAPSVHPLTHPWDQQSFQSLPNESLEVSIVRERSL